MSSSHKDEGGRTPGAAGRPEPGSGHDDSKTETVAEGPPVEPVDGVPGAHGEVETRGGAVNESSQAGPAAEVADEMDGGS